MFSPREQLHCGVSTDYKCQLTGDLFPHRVVLFLFLVPKYFIKLTQKLLLFNFSEGCWQWNIEQIQCIDITNNVVELMVDQIKKLSQKTQNVLKLAACIGDKFTLDVLAIVNEKSQSETANDLWEALQAGLILPLSEAYKVPLVLDLETSITWQVEPLKVGYKFVV